MKKRWNVKKFMVHGLGFVLARVGLFGLYPFIMPFFAAVYRERLSGKISFLVLLAGVATGLDKDAVMRYGITMVTVLVAAKLAEGKGEKLQTPVMGLLAGVITSAVYIGGSFFQVGAEPQWIVGIMEGVFVFVGTIVVHKGIYYLLYDGMERKPDQKELISLAVLALAFIYGLPQFRGGQISFVYPLLNLAVLVTAYRFGAGPGSMVGALAGAVAGYETGQMELVGCFCLMGMAAGLVREVGRLPSAITYLLGSLAIGFLWTDFFIGTAGLKGTIPAVLLFPLLPGKWFASKDVVVEGTEETAISNMQLIMREKVREMALGFRRLAEVMDYQMEPRHALSGGELNHIFNGVSEHCCGECSKRNVCLKSDFQDTYHVVFRMLNSAQKRGKVVNEDVPLNFTERCMQVQQFVAEANRELQIARMNLQWQNRLAESREVVADQFIGLAGMMEEFAAGVSTAAQKQNGKEVQIRARLQAAGLEVSQAAVMRRPDDRDEVYLTLRVRGGGCITTKEVAAALEEVLAKSFHPSIRAKSVVSKDWTTLTLVEDTSYHFYSGMASCCREGENWSGDSHSVLQLPDGNAVLMLSDGMGSGKRASEESTRVVELLEQFLEAGMDPESAVKMIHSSMLMRREEDSFSTIDLCLMDLCAGVGKFVKVGAAPSYRIRNGELEKVASVSLPIGMVSEMDMDDISVRLKDGDFLIMATDGFYEQFERGEDVGSVEDVLRAVVNERNGNNASELARKLLDAALIRTGGSPTDDIAVMVAGIWS